MKVIVLKESGRFGHIYSHWTNINGIIGILKKNTLLGNVEFRKPLENKITVSLSRVGNGKTNQIPYFVKETKEPTWIRLYLDAEKINDRYKIVPFEFYQNSRKDQESQHEEAVIVGKGSITVVANIMNGQVVFNDDFNAIEKVLDSTGKEVKFNKEIQGYEIDGEINSFDIDYDTEGHVHTLNIYDEEGNWLDGIEYQDFEIKNTNKSFKGIKNITNYIKSVEVPDVLMMLLEDEIKDYIYMNGNPLNLDNYIKKVLHDGATGGLHGDEFQRTVKHKITNFKEFYDFLVRELGKDKIKEYKIPSSWYTINENYGGVYR